MQEASKGISLQELCTTGRVSRAKNGSCAMVLVMVGTDALASATKPSAGLLFRPILRYFYKK